MDKEGEQEPQTHRRGGKPQGKAQRATIGAAEGEADQPLSEVALPSLEEAINCQIVIFDGQKMINEYEFPRSGSFEDIVQEQSA